MAPTYSFARSKHARAPPLRVHFEPNIQQNATEQSSKAIMHLMYDPLDDAGEQRGCNEQTVVALKQSWRQTSYSTQHYVLYYNIKMMNKILRDFCPSFCALRSESIESRFDIFVDHQELFISPPQRSEYPFTYQ